eukprot:scaffold25923_cov105-Isochrysis_galbana.AAC.4
MADASRASTATATGATPTLQQRRPPSRGTRPRRGAAPCDAPAGGIGRSCLQAQRCHRAQHRASCGAYIVVKGALGRQVRAEVVVGVAQHERERASLQRKERRVVGPKGAMSAAHQWGGQAARGRARHAQGQHGAKRGPRDPRRRVGGGACTGWMRPSRRETDGDPPRRKFPGHPPAARHPRAGRSASRGARPRDSGALSACCTAQRRPAPRGLRKEPNGRNRVAGAQ